MNTGPATTRIAAGRVAFGLCAAAMVATPLLRPGRRRLAASAVVGGLAGATGLAAAARWGPRRALAAFAVVSALATGVERVGSTTGVPFGRYRYTGALRPEILGVPAIVPVAWFAMALPAREAAHATLAGRSSRSARAVLGSVALAAWDLFLDPQMVSEGYWRWARPGRYRGIPLTNFAGWLATGLGIMVALEALLPTQHGPDRTLTGLYGWMGAMETLGFAAFFEDRLVAAVGGAAMVPMGALALWRSTP